MVLLNDQDARPYIVIRFYRHKRRGDPVGVEYAGHDLAVSGPLAVVEVVRRAIRSECARGAAIPAAGVALQRIFDKPAPSKFSRPSRKRRR